VHRKIGGKGGSPLVPLAFLLFLVTTSVSAQNREPLLGTWRLNFTKSKFISGPPPYARVTCKIVPWADGLKVTYDMVGERGGVTHWEWIGKLDGNDYALQGNEELVTNAYSRIGDNVYEVVNKVNGRATSATQIAISPDGKVMTVTSKVSAQGQSVVNTAIYEKR
jgi:hypothetical protein